MFSDYFSFRSNLEAWQENHSWLVKNIKADEEANDLIFFQSVSIFLYSLQHVEIKTKSRASYIHAVQLKLHWQTTARIILLVYVCAH